MSTPHEPDTNKPNLHIDSISVYDILRENNAFTEKQAKAQLKIMQNLATKDDIKNMATKDDIKNMATKDDIKNLASQMATKEDLAHLESKMHNMETRMIKEISYLKTEISSLKTPMIFWIPTVMIAQTMVVLTMIKYL